MYGSVARYVRGGHLKACVIDLIEIGHFDGSAMLCNTGQSVSLNNLNLKTKQYSEVNQGRKRNKKCPNVNTKSVFYKLSN